jgi:hypothetical protein
MSRKSDNCVGTAFLNAQLNDTLRVSNTEGTSTVGTIGWLSHRSRVSSEEAQRGGSVVTNR